MSISRRLAYGLTAVILSSVAFIVLLIAVVAPVEERANMRADCADSAARLALILASPLNDVDLLSASQLARAFESDPRVVRITVKESLRGDSVVIGSSTSSDTVSNRRTVRYTDQVTGVVTEVGEVTVAFDRGIYRARIWRDIRIALLVSTLALVAMLVGIRRLLRRLIRRPLTELSAVVTRYSAGDYSAPPQPIGEGELKTFSAVLTDMGHRIVEQLDALRHANVQLEEEVLAHRLTNEELKLRAAALAATADTVVITDADAKIEWVNPAFTQVTGYAFAEVIGKNPRILASGLTPRGIYTELWQTILSGRSWRGVLTNRRKDGQLFREEVSITPIVGADGTIRHYVAVKQDITDKERTAEQVELMKQSIDAHPDGAFWFDASNRFVYCNEAAERRLGYARGELIGQSVLVVSPRATEDVLQGIWAELRRDGRRVAQSTHRRKDGTEFPVEIISTYVLFDSKEYVYGFATDITERLRMEREHDALQSQLIQAQKMESVGRLAGGVAHDFNNMLGVILGNCELALLRGSRAEDVVENLEEILTAATKSADLTRQLLAFARKQEIAPRMLDLNRTIADSLKMLHRLIGAGIDLRWEPGRDVWQVSMDPSQLDQILANLCVNARDAIDDVGTVMITTANAALDAVFCATHPDAEPGDYVCVTVADSGSGMSDDVISHVFEPFFTTKAVGEGTGLGLATVYGAVRQNRGFIVVQSHVGEGTTFAIYLPRHEAHAEAAMVEGPPLVERGKETILVVDDEPALLQVASAWLRELGYRVLAAPGPIDAIQLASADPASIDLLLTDVIMPGMTGINLAKTLGALRPRLKCLLMSGFAAQQAASTPTDITYPLIRKPFAVAALAAKVREVLDAPSDALASLDSESSPRPGGARTNSP